MPAAVICTQPFENMGRATARIRGIPDYPFYMLPHPFGRLSEADLEQRLDAAMAAVESLILKGTLAE
ncbi:MAG: hypothetical protein U0821_10475 [Chloroflexota bacterium]